MGCCCYVLTSVLNLIGLIKAVSMLKGTMIALDIDLKCLVIVVDDDMWAIGLPVLIMVEVAMYTSVALVTPA